MGSGTSYFNMTLFRKNLARFWPIWGLYALIWVVLLPAGVLLRRDVWDKGNAWEFPLVLLDGSRNMALVLAFLFGILCAMAVFSYLYSARSVGMLHALPMRREGLFLTNYLSGLAFLWVPNFAVFLLALAAEALNGTVVFSSLFTWLVVTCLLCLFFYSFAVFCAMFTGHILALPAFYLILNFLASVITYLLESIAREFLFGFNGAVWAEKWAFWFTPALKLLRATGLDYMSSTPRYFGLGLVVLYALIGLVLAGIALAVYCRRQLERAGDVITVGWVRPVFRYGMALCCAITLGAFFYAIFYPLLPQGPWTLLGWMLLWGAVGCFIAEMLLKKRLWVFKTSWKGCVVFLVCLVAAMATLELDLLGFERRVPDAAQVKTVEIRGISSAPYDSADYLDFSTSDPQTIEEITSLHSSITDRKDELEAVQASPPHSMTKRPPWRRTRERPAATGARSGIQWRTAFEKTPSKGAPRSGRAAASAWMKRRAGYLARARAIIGSEASTPIASAPRWAIWSVRAPVPQPRSRMRSPGRGASQSSNAPP